MKEVQTDVEEIINIEELAEQWIATKRRKAEVEDELKAIETTLRAHVNETGEVKIGVITAFEKATPAKLEVIDTKYDLDRQKEQLLAALSGSDYIKESIDVTGLHKAYNHEKFVQRALLKCKLMTTQSKEWYFKAP